MIYDSIDTIPLKLYFKIESTKAYQLISDKIIDIKKAKNTFLEIKKEYEKIVPPKHNNTLDKLSNLNQYDCQKRACVIAIYILKNGWNSQMANILNTNGFKITEATHEQDLIKIESEIEGIDFLMEDIIKQLNLKKDEKKITLDTYYAYASKILGVLLDANNITLSQHLSYTEVVNKEIETRKKQWQKGKSLASK